MDGMVRRSSGAWTQGRRRGQKVFHSFVAAIVLLQAFLPSTFAAPQGFRDELVAQIPESTSISFTPRLDGNGHMLFVSTKSGDVVLLPDFENDPDNQKVILSLKNRICWNGGRGLSSALPHPEFATNPNKRWLYVYYTWKKHGNCGEDDKKGPVARIERYTMKEDLTLDMNSEKLFIEGPPLTHVIHNNGDLQFGADGHLYITIGDGGAKGKTSQDPGMIQGVAMRVTDDNEIPADNPYVGEDSARCNVDGVIPQGSKAKFCQEVYAIGLRNPFRMTLHPQTGLFWVDDVGGQIWEETNILEPGKNYGWKEREGPCQAHKDEKKFCGDPGEPYTDPYHWYAHTKEGGAAVGCAFVPPGLWPAEYDNKFLFADYVFNYIYVLEDDPDNYCRDCNPPTPGTRNSTFHEFERIVQLTFGPFQGSQALYYTSRKGNNGDIRRIYYTGEENRGPVASLSASPTEVEVGVEVEFDASLSRDADFDTLTYEWDFGDGTTRETQEAIVKHSYNARGTYIASVTVRDPDGFENQVFVQIIVGVGPTVEMLSPAEGTEFAVGDVFTLTGLAVDRFGQAIPDEDLTWEVRQHHSTHWHPFMDPTNGNNIVLSKAPGPEDFLASTNSHLEIRLTATDSDGVIALVSRVVMPKMVDLLFQSIPSGMTLIIDDFEVTTPINVTSWQDYQLKLDAPNEDPYFFKEWQHGGEQTHTITVPPKQDDYFPTYVAVFETFEPETDMEPTPATVPPAAGEPTRPRDQPTRPPSSEDLETPPPAPTTSGSGNKSYPLVLLLVSLSAALGIYLC